MSAKKRTKNIDENLKNAAKTIGKALARSHNKLEKTGREAAEKVGKFIDKASNSAEKALGSALKKIQKLESEKGAKVGSRLMGRSKKNISLTLGELAGEIAIYLNQEGKIKVKKLVDVMMNRRNTQAMVFAAIGWLAKEDKVQISKDGENISLKG